MKPWQFYDKIILGVSNKKQKNKVKNVEELRCSLYKIIESGKDLCDDKILSISRELDEKIISYYKMVNKKFK